MRKIAVALLALVITSAAFAQRQPMNREHVVRGPYSMGVPPALLYDVDSYSTQLQNLSMAVKRDAFIVAQMVAATGELHEQFQKHVALEKAHDHIDAAFRKATEMPPASQVVITAVSQANDIVNHWRDNASSADLNDITRQVLIKTN